MSPARVGVEGIASVVEIQCDVDLIEGEPRFEANVRIECKLQEDKDCEAPKMRLEAFFYRNEVLAVVHNVKS